MIEQVVFLGPSLPREEAAKLLDAEYRAPAQRGDVYACLGCGVRRILLIDGLFHGVPSVWQRELLAAIDEGIEVLGASSMGALRATELLPYGMQGFGRIFESYRDGVIDGDYGSAADKTMPATRGLRGRLRREALSGASCDTWCVSFLR